MEGLQHRGPGEDQQCRGGCSQSIEQAPRVALLPQEELEVLGQGSVQPPGEGVLDRGRSMGRTSVPRHSPRDEIQDTTIQNKE